jgi:MurNAc alpha-1-phosphate uridylyltransferase
LGDGSRYGVRIVYSREAQPLETAGGIAFALPLLGDDPFLVVNSDVYCDFDFARLAAPAAKLARHRGLAHLVLVDNPPHHARGDFVLTAGKVSAEGTGRLTFSGIGVYAPALFANVARGARCQLVTLLQPAMARGLVTGEPHGGLWMDIGTPVRLEALEHALDTRSGC